VTRSSITPRSCSYLVRMPSTSRMLKDEPPTSSGYFHIGIDYFDRAPNADGGVFYFGVQPGFTGAVHMGMFAPYFGLTFGFDHYAGTGKIADLAQANNVKTDANGFGFGLLFGLDLVFNPSVSAGIGAEIHPGFTTLDPGNGIKSQDLGHAALLFEGKYHF
ncbi:MAG TPA: hypothetical protein VH062_17270, partial [Polyangiaceae bacterium]|nr:hypothetical protein [Polyangiaceae bacterium]